MKPLKSQIENVKAQVAKADALLDTLRAVGDTLTGYEKIIAYNNSGGGGGAGAPGTSGGGSGSLHIAGLVEELDSAVKQLASVHARIDAEVVRIKDSLS